MNPEQAVTLVSLTLDGKTVQAYEIVWVLNRSGGQAEIEHRDRRGRVAESVLVPYPVKGPGIEVLRQLDPCFGLGPEAFTDEHRDQERYFTILRCKAHGRRFLDDTRGGFAMYSRLTLLLEDDDGSPRDIWSKYHGMSDSQLLLEGRTL
jgi:hypothetical protein